MRDPAARQSHFQRLTRPWRDRLYGVALRRAGTPHVAEEWTQETLLRAWRDFDRLGDEVAVYAWLLKILDRVAADDFRRGLRRARLAPMVTTDDPLLTEHPCAAPGPFERTLQQQHHDQLIAAIDTLPDEFRQAILLRDIEGLSYREVADILDIPRGTVMSRLSRGRRQLSAILLKRYAQGSRPGGRGRDAGAKR